MDFISVTCQADVVTKGFLKNQQIKTRQEKNLYGLTIKTSDQKRNFNFAQISGLAKKQTSSKKKKIKTFREQNWFLKNKSQVSQSMSLCHPEAKHSNCGVKQERQFQQKEKFYFKALWR